MGVTAFNASEYPQVWPFEGFTLKWFAALVGDDDITYGLRNSLLIGVLVVALSVPVGLAGAILMTQVYRRARRSEEHTSELQSLMRISYAVFCLKKKPKSQLNLPDPT